MRTAECRTTTLQDPVVALFPPLPEVQRASRAGAYAAWLAISIIWGTTFVAIRVAIETIPTLLVTGFRFVSAGLILVVIAGLTGARFPRQWREWRDQMLSGIVMVGLGNTLVVYAEHAITGGLAALLAATIPIWMVLMESRSGGPRMTGRKMTGLALGFGGVGLLVAPAIGRLEMSLPFILAVAAMQGSAICWNAGTLYSRRNTPTGDPMAIAVIQMLSGGAAVMIVALLTGAQPTLAMFSFRSTMALIYLSVFGSVIAWTAFLYALTRLSAGVVSSYAYINPIVAVITGAILLSEPVTVRMLVAMFVILAGVAVIQLDRFRPALKEIR